MKRGTDYVPSSRLNCLVCFAVAGKQKPPLCSMHAAAPNLLAACKKVYKELHDRYDVDRPGQNIKEYPFNGAGELLSALKEAITLAEAA